MPILDEAGFRLLLGEGPDAAREVAQIGADEADTAVPDSTAPDAARWKLLQRNPLRRNRTRHECG